MTALTTWHLRNRAVPSGKIERLRRLAWVIDAVGHIPGGVGLNATDYTGEGDAHLENLLRPTRGRWNNSPRDDSVGLSNRPFPLGKDHRGAPRMVVATAYDVPSLARARVSSSPADARLFALVEELKHREKRRDELLDRLSVEDGDQIEAVAKGACDAARAIYEQIIAIQPTTAAGVLRQLELAAKGWVAPSTLPIAMAALREIADRPPPLKIGRLPPIPMATRLGNNSDIRQTTPTPA